MAFNKNELILDRVRSATYHDLTTNEVIFRLTSIEEPSLNTTAESEEVTDAIGATIATLYRAKKGTFSGTNSLINLGLYAEQQGTKKIVGSSEATIDVPTFEIIDLGTGENAQTTATLSHVAKDPTAIKYIYSIADGEIGVQYSAGTSVTGKIYVEYTYTTADAVKVKVTADEFPTMGSLIVYAYFKDKCNENLVYSGIILIPKAKLNPESIELALTSTGKHPFEFTMAKDYCSDDGDLFEIIVAE